MRCPFCHFDDSKVIDSRTKSNGTVIRRRRMCSSCGKRFTTKEVMEEPPLLVIKADQSREPFDRSKLKKGIMMACTKRPISAEIIDEITNKIEQSLRERALDEIESHEIGRHVMNHLKRLDQVAYVRFASVYRNFQDKEEFLSELKEL
ncbi:transcriptional repressor NrdR [candidate division KSB1 bacterium]|nr:transcriptional repressor NrdR [candidate division KSB1 bacterium]